MRARLLMYVLWTAGSGTVALVSSILLLRRFAYILPHGRVLGLTAFLAVMVAVMLPLEALGVALLGIRIARRGDGTLVLVAKPRRGIEEA